MRVRHLKSSFSFLLREIFMSPLCWTYSFAVFARACAEERRGIAGAGKRFAYNHPQVTRPTATVMRATDPSKTMFHATHPGVVALQREKKNRVACAAWAYYAHVGVNRLLLMMMDSNIRNLRPSLVKIICSSLKCQTALLESVPSVLCVEGVLREKNCSSIFAKMVE